MRGAPLRDHPARKITPKHKIREKKTRQIPKPRIEIQVHSTSHIKKEIQNDRFASSGFAALRRWRATEMSVHIQTMDGQVVHNQIINTKRLSLHAPACRATTSPAYKNTRQKHSSTTTTTITTRSKNKTRHQGPTNPCGLSRRPHPHPATPSLSRPNAPRLNCHSRSRRLRLRCHHLPSQTSTTPLHLHPRPRPRRCCCYCCCGCCRHPWPCC